ncbi:hypothetical protein [Mycobacterium sp. 141]|uniref:hypothetical protein n=1 Tax=Mycobacterium sp. 141 TaxID=1120797 RepID=UPI0003A507EC|nr:hypothetical protein [Mycobacterium sp. 141]
MTTFERGKDAGVRRDIASVVDIYKVAADQIRQTIRNYESGTTIGGDASTGTLTAVPPLAHVAPGDQSRGG